MTPIEQTILTIYLVGAACTAVGLAVAIGREYQLTEDRERRNYFNRDASEGLFLLGGALVALWPLVVVGVIFCLPFWVGRGIGYIEDRLAERKATK